MDRPGPTSGYRGRLQPLNLPLAPERHDPVPCVSSAPFSLIRRSSVGKGECGPLVQQATSAPSTPFWKRGALVQGATSLKPGAAIATFDASGRYGNHTAGTSHAAIYLGQDARVSRSSTSGTSGSIIGWSASTPRQDGCRDSRIPIPSRLIRGAVIMWSIEPTAALLLIASSTAAYAATGCPLTNGSHSLSSVEVFDGPPAEMALLEPGDGGWKLNYKAAPPDGHFYLGCHYAGDQAPLAVKLPLTVSDCSITRFPQISCR